MKYIKKRLMAGLVACCLILTGGCEIDEKIYNVNKTPEESQQQNLESIVMCYQTIGNSKTEGLDAVLAAINEITVPEIGVEVEFLVEDATEAHNTYPLWLSQGESIDLINLNNQDITAYIGKGLLLPLDELLESCAPTINGAIAQGHTLTEAAVIDEQVYGVTSIYDLKGSGGGIWVPKKIMDRCGLAFDERNVYSLDEVEDFLESFKKLYPDSYPLGQITEGNTFSTASFYIEPMESGGSCVNAGVLHEQRFVNYYETQGYLDLLQHLREWYLKGYIYPDGFFTNSSTLDLLKAGVILSWPLSSEPGIVTAESVGEELVCIKTTEIMKLKQHTKSGFWVIPTTSRNPEAAMKFLNMMYEDTRISNLLTWGIEEVNYIKSGDRQITFPKGESSQTVSFYNPLHLYGDYRNIYTMDSQEMIRQKKMYNESVIEKNQEYSGFTYDSSKMTKQITKVNEVIQKYVPLFESGSIDLEMYYPEFLEELKQAGIDEILQDKQNQYKKWSEGEFTP